MGSWSLRGLEVMLFTHPNRVMRNAAYGIRRIHLLGTSVNTVNKAYSLQAFG
jgi:hypothetical protein